MQTEPEYDSDDLQSPTPLNDSLSGLTEGDHGDYYVTINYGSDGSIRCMNLHKKIT